MTISAEIRDRIIAAADELYEEGGKERFPSVSDVRGRARTDMNSTSLVMKEWRKAKRSRMAAPAVTIPEVVANAANAALATVWVQAQEVASEALRSAQSEWEQERAEMETMHAEVATAFEQQAKELTIWQESAVTRAKEYETAIREKDAALSAMREERDEARQEVAKARQEASEARERAAMAEGEIKALREQVATLMQKLEPIDKKK